MGRRKPQRRRVWTLAGIVCYEQGGQAIVETVCLSTIETTFQRAARKVEHGLVQSIGPVGRFGWVEGPQLIHVANAGPLVA